MFTDHYLRGALAPKSVAVVGATVRPDALGAHVLRNLLAGGFRGEVYAVNPKYTEIDRRPCFPTLAALPTARPGHLAR